MNMSLRERKKIETRQQLLAAAEDLFARRSFGEVTVDEIADVANVSQKTFFNYFASKSQLLKELVLDWQKSAPQWAEEVETEPTGRSAITPANIEDILDWVVQHRRLLKMALKHTDFFDFIYAFDRNEGDDEYDLFSRIRKPRLDRVKKAQERRLIRDDVPAHSICNLYDSLRIEVVKRWLYLPDAEATPTILQERYYEAIEVLFAGVSLVGETIPEARPRAAVTST